MKVNKITYKMIRNLIKESQKRVPCCVWISCVETKTSVCPAFMYAIFSAYTFMYVLWMQKYFAEFVSDDMHVRPQMCFFNK